MPAMLGVDESVALRHVSQDSQKMEFVELHVAKKADGGNLNAAEGFGGLG